MIFNSFTYVFFLAIVVVVYWLLPRRPRQLFLFAASVTFYGFWRFDYVFIMLASAFTDFFAAINIHNAKAPARRRLWLALSLAVNFGLLVLFQVRQLHRRQYQRLGASHRPRRPVGDLERRAAGRDQLLYVPDRELHGRRLSWADRTDPRAAALRAVRHLLRAPRRRADPARRRGDPAARSPQAVQRRVPGRGLCGSSSTDCFSNARSPTTSGGYVDEGFGANPTTLSATDVWVLAVLFGFQIYFDFAAYSQDRDLAQPRLMYVDLSPQLLFSLRRHIAARFLAALAHLAVELDPGLSLSAAVRRASGLAYLRGGLVPVGDQVGVARRNAALVATWFIMGLWHGAGWTFALWGLWHALLILVQRAIAGFGLLRQHTRLRGVLGWVFTFPAVMLGWIFFRAQNLEQAWEMIHKVLQPGKYLLLDRLHTGYVWLALPIGIDPVGYLIAAILPVATLIAYFIYRDLSLALVAARFDRLARGRGLRGGGCGFVFIYLRPVRQFIYFQF